MPRPAPAVPDDASDDAPTGATAGVPAEARDALPPFVSAATVAALGDRVTLADVRWSLDGREGHATYLEGHLPAAVHVDLDRDLSGPASPGAGRHPLPSPEAFATALGRRGIADDVPVVAYDTLGGAVAARLVWLLRAIGQPAAVLDGGLAAWPGPQERGEVEPVPVTRAVTPWPAARLVDADAVAALAAGPAADGVLVDVRAPERFRGDLEPVDPRAGHVPGARNVPVGDHLEGGRLRDPASLRERYARAGALADRDVAVACGSGVNACLGLLALETLGVEGRLFAPSWSGWSSDPTRPVATGDA